jgi:hypothetical protein
VYRILHGQPGRRFGDIGEFERLAHIAGGVDRGVRCAQEIVDADSLARLALDARGLQAQFLHIRHRSDAEQNLIDWNGKFQIVIDRIDQFGGVRGARARDRGVQARCDAVARQGHRQQVRSIPLFVRQEFGIILQDGDLRPQPAEGLGQFATERAAADDAEARGQCANVEDRFAGEVPHLLESRNIRRPGPGAGRDDCPIEERPGIAKAADFRLIARAAEIAPDRPGAYLGRRSVPMGSAPTRSNSLFRNRSAPRR